jgi:cytoskeletal protein CcmA (bactofilin family)
MFRKKEAEAETTSSETIVGTSVKLRGNLKSEGNVKIEGNLTGEIKARGDVFITQTADIKAKIKAKNVTISGTVNGNIEAEERIEISESGKVFGDVASNILIIKEGAIFSGKSIMEVKSLEEKEEEEKEPKPEYEIEEK